MANQVIEFVDGFVRVRILSAPIRRRILHVQQLGGVVLLDHESEIPATHARRSRDNDREKNQVEQCETADVGHVLVPEGWEAVICTLLSYLLQRLSASVRPAQSFGVRQD